MRAKLTSVLVDNQEKALQFYTTILGFVKKKNIPLGEFRWLTVVSPEEPEGTEVVLEPDVNPAAKTFKKALVEQKIPCAAFVVDDLQKEYERLKKLNVVFTMSPTEMGEIMLAVFNDTCGNLIQLYQEIKKM